MPKFMKTAACVLATTALLATTQSVSAQGFEGQPAEASVALNVRAGPGTGNRVVDVLYAGERVSVEECRSNGWCYIEHSGPDGWVSSRYLDAAGGSPDPGDDDGPSFGGTARSTVALNVRSGPGTNHRIIDALYEGQVVDVDECLGNGWCRINTGSESGWVAGRYLERTGGGSGGGGEPSDGDGLANSIARSTTALNVRTGPGTRFRVIDALYTGERVNVGECRSNGWCRISSADGNGWVFSRYLRPAGGDSDRDPDIGFTITTPGFSFSIGNGADFDIIPPRRDRDGQACFFEHFDFQGSSFCASPGDRDAQLQTFNDRISSIRVTGDIDVQVCEDFNFEGRCAVVDSSQARLEGRNNDIISSFRAR